MLSFDSSSKKTAEKEVMSFLSDTIDTQYPMIVLSLGIYKIAHLQSFLGQKVVYSSIFGSIYYGFIEKKYSAVLAWGRRPSYHVAYNYSIKNKIPLITLEDGFLRSIGLGRQGYQPVSLVVDDVGIYFNAYQPSRLELYISEGIEQKDRAIECIKKILKYNLSKYNHAPNLDLENYNSEKRNILVIDQTVGDQSIPLSGASQDTFFYMLEEAKKNSQDAVVWIKTHPEVSAKSKKGFFSDVKSSDNLRLITNDINPICLLKMMDEVYVVSSHMGFEALLLEKKVYCFGVPWYAGWGLTIDQYAPIEILKKRRAVNRTITQLFSAAYFKYSKYIDPITGASCEIEQAISWLIKCTKWNNNLRGRVHAIGFSQWKKFYFSKVFDLPSVEIQWHKKEPKSLDLKDCLMVWGSKDIKVHNYPIWRMEDGFIRSVGLGAKLVRPMSIMLDVYGIYYDPAKPSKLENYLDNCNLNEREIERAKILRETIVKNQLSKYNVGHDKNISFYNGPLKKVLVPGQVEDDASVRYGGGLIQSNLDLLKAVRHQCPDAFIIYKPHPDVQAGLRKGVIDEKELFLYCNLVVVDLDMAVCLSSVDEVHTLTSLTGFEALLRGIGVTCYGLPFYAGWGLTTDLVPCARRQRNLNLDELVYGTLIECPIYMIPNRPGFAEVEQVIDHILAVRKHDDAQKKHVFYAFFLTAVAHVRAILSALYSFGRHN